MPPILVARNSTYTPRNTVHVGSCLNLLTIEKQVQYSQQEVIQYKYSWLGLIIDLFMVSVAILDGEAIAAKVAANVWEIIQL